MWQSHHTSHSFIFVKFTLCHRLISAVASNNCAIDHLHKDHCTRAFGRNTLSKPHTTCSFAAASCYSCRQRSSASCSLRWSLASTLAFISTILHWLETSFGPKGSGLWHLALTYIDLILLISFWWFCSSQPISNWLWSPWAFHETQLWWWLQPRRWTNST